MASRDKIVNFLDTTLDTSSFSDVSLNGLQVEGQTEIKRIAVAVDACLETVTSAAEKARRC